MTPLFLLACVATYVVMVACGVPALWPSGRALVDWGANHGPRVLLRHEYWRLLTSVFVHGGLIHLAMNMWSLYVIGPLVERLYGNLAFAVVYLAAGVGGAIASIAASPERIGVGASGAICGVLGALVAFLATHRRSIPSPLWKSLRANVLAIVVVMAILGFMVPNIDQEAHLGGLATGFVSGLLLYRPLPVQRGPWTTLRRGLATIVIVAATASAAWTMARRAGPALSPLVRIGDFTEQVARATAELDAIYDELPGTLVLRAIAPTSARPKRSARSRRARAARGRKPRSAAPGHDNGSRAAGDGSFSGRGPVERSSARSKPRAGFSRPAIRRAGRTRRRPRQNGRDPPEQSQIHGTTSEIYYRAQDRTTAVVGAGDPGPEVARPGCRSAGRRDSVEARLGASRIRRRRFRPEGRI